MRPVPICSRITGDLTGVRVAVTASRVAHIDDLQKHVGRPFLRSLPIQELTSHYMILTMSDDVNIHLQGETLLHFAVKGRRANIIKYCLELGADVNRRNKIVRRSSRSAGHQ